MQDEVSVAGIFRDVRQIDLEEVAEKLLRQAVGHKVWMFYGELGSGKTTLIRAIGEAMKSGDKVRSPSFSILNEYALNGHQRIYHFDFYRVRSEREVHDLGVTEYLDSGNYCFIEWPEMIRSLVDGPFVEINLTVQADNLRTISASIHGREEKKRI